MKGQMTTADDHEVLPPTERTRIPFGEIIVTRRPLWRRVLRFPFVCRGHYRVMRRHGVGRLLAMYGAWMLAGQSLGLGWMGALVLAVAGGLC